MSLAKEGDEVRKRRSNAGGQGRDRTADLPIFSRTLYQLSYLTRNGADRCDVRPAMA
jgi:hypothetical protein